MGKIRRVDYSPDEFLVGTTCLSLEETGAYWKVCSLIYSHGGPIDDDDRWIAGAIAADVRKWKPIKARLLSKGKLRTVDGRLTNDRCERELSKTHKRIESAHRNGTLGGRPAGRSRRDVGEMSARSPGDHPTDVSTSFGHPDEIAGSDLLEINGVTKPEGFHAGKPNKEPPTTNHHIQMIDREETASPFETFWRTYPSRRPHDNPRKPACAKFETAVKRGIDPAAIIAGAERYAAYVQRERVEPRFIKQAVTWLSQECWTESHAAPEPPRPAPGLI